MTSGARDLRPGTLAAAWSARSNARAFALAPSREGCNIGQGLGFKHVTYLMESVVERCMDAAAVAVSGLYWQSGLRFMIRGSRVRYVSVVLADEVVHAVVAPHVDGSDLRFEVELFGRRLMVEHHRLASGTFRAHFLDADGRVVTPVPARVAAALATEDPS